MGELKTITKIPVGAVALMGAVISAILGLIEVNNLGDWPCSFYSRHCLARFLTMLALERLGALGAHYR